MKMTLALVAASFLFACGGQAPGPAQKDVPALGTQTAAEKSADSKVAICHETGSAKNPFVVINVSQNAVPAHIPHHDGDHFYNNGQCCNAQSQYCATDGDCCSGLSCQSGSCAPNYGACHTSEDCPYVSGVLFDCQNGYCVPLNR